MFQMSGPDSTLFPSHVSCMYKSNSTLILSCAGKPLRFKIACWAPILPNTVLPPHDLTTGVPVTGTVAGNVQLAVSADVLKLLV